MGGWNIVYALINFVILAAALYFLGRKIVVKTLESRRSQIADELEKAKKAGETAEQLRENMQQEREHGNLLIAQADEHARKIIEEASEKMLVGDSNASTGIKKAAKRDAEQLQRDLRKDLTHWAAGELAQTGAQSLRDKITEDDRKKLRDSFTLQLEKTIVATPGDRVFMRDTGNLRITLSSGERLDAEYVLRIEEIIRNVFEISEVPVSVVTDESIIGGVRLKIDDTVYDGTLNDMLRRLRRLIDEGEALGENMVEELGEKIARADTCIDMYQTGTVVSLSDGICHVSGISDAMAGEMLEFEGNLLGMVEDLNQDDVGVVLLSEYDKVQAGDEVRRTGKIIEVPVGEAMKGRVVDALGRPVDGKGLIHTNETRPIESPAPDVLSRKSVSVPLQTGLKAVDALVPIGRGQRELIIGDRQTGKTAIAVDAIINQKGKDVICIYVAIGQKKSTVAAVVEKLRMNGAMFYTTVVCANASEPAPMLYIAPYAGAAIGEYFMHKGKDVLIVYDDLSKHAVAYREISLLLHRPPGREAYPGDVFYLHSRLLERAARLSDECGGGSMTALPIIETRAGDISAYIPTNVISITDGQIFLETELFNEGIRPAINAGLSVSRVGGAAQLPAMKQVAGRLRMDLAQYRELAVFAQFGSDLDKVTIDTLRRGEKMTEMLKQGRYQPMSAPDQIIALFTANEGLADDVEAADMERFEKDLIGFVNRRFPEFSSSVQSGNKMSAQDMERLRSLITEFKASFK